MPLAPNQNDKGMFLNPQAIDARTKKWLAKLVTNVLKEAEEESLVPMLLVPNPLTREMGTQGKFYDWGQLVAHLKPDAVPTGVQAPKPGDVTYELDEYEVKVGISDRAKLNSQMSAQDMLNAGKSGRAFARAIDAQGLTEYRDNSATGAAAGGWDVATDATIMQEIAAAMDAIWNAGYTPDAIVMTQAQSARIARIGLTYSTPLTAKQLLQAQHETIKNLYIWRKITYIDQDGSTITLFDPTGYFGILATKSFGVFTQRPVTVETFRDVDAGVDFAYMRKYFQAKTIQSDAGYVISGCVI